uniref:UV excision repair protein RAD23 n=1 Tax=Arcella intermedia TaxID=1963864 RepID=A0A6B2L907_9EUKA
MKITIKTVRNEKFELEVEPNFTIDKVKELLESKYRFEKSSQTLIFQGKVLLAEKMIEELKIGAEDFFVLMVKSKKPAEPSSASTATSTTAPPTTTPAPSTTAPTTTTVVPGDNKVADALLVGSELDKAINNIVDMGFPKDQVVAAMRASFNNPARAIEYLTSGLPPQVQAPPPVTPANASTPAQPRAPVQSTPTPARTGGGSGVFDGLRQHPQFPQLCLHAQQGGEEALKQILTYFAEVSPPLVQLIGQHQEEFIQLLNTPVQVINRTPGGPVPTPTQAPTGPGVIRVQVTPEDERVINGLVNMGFDRNRVLEAYFLFDKDEQMTANFLLNNPDGDMGQ